MIVLVGLRPVEAALLRKRRRVRATLRVKVGVAVRAISRRVIRELGVHVFDRRTFEHDTDRTFELELVGAIETVRRLVRSAARARPDVISITTD